jgi:hypothetical protein
VTGGDFQQPVVFGDPLAPGRCPGFQLPAAGADGEVGDEGVGGLTGPVRHQLGVPAAPARRDRLQRLGDGADLVDLDQRRVPDAAGDGVGDDGRIGDEDVVADELDPVAQPGGERGPAVPVVLAQAVLDQPDWNRSVICAYRSIMSALVRLCPAIR